MRARGPKGRFTSWAKVRNAKLGAIEPALQALSSSLAETTRETAETGARITAESLYSNTIRFDESLPWDQVIGILNEAPVGKVPQHPRVRFHIGAIDEQGRVQPLSRAYTSPEIALGEAVSLLERGTVMSPKDDGGPPADDSLMWRGIVVSVFLRKDAMR